MARHRERHRSERERREHELREHAWEREQGVTLEEVGRGLPWGPSLGVYTCSSRDIAEAS